MSTQGAGDANPQRLFVYNGGFLTQPRIRRILTLAGYDIRLGKPKSGDAVGVWGKSPTSPRGEKIADLTDTPVVRVEDAFLRSLHPGRDGNAPPLGLHIDTRGVHFDSSSVSDLEHLLTKHPLDDTAILNRARNASEWIKASSLSKYNAFDPAAEIPEPGYVLVIDQTAGDASITHGKANAAMFQEMLVFAQEENPGQRVLIKTHPETQNGHRGGHFNKDHVQGRVRIFDKPCSPWALFEGATSIYTVSSQMGFEAIYAGHKPHVFGQPFYSGWGLTNDRNPVARRERKLTRAQLFAAAMILYPTWYDPYRDRLCELEDVIATLESQARAWREDRHGWAAVGMRAWKKAPLQKVFGQQKPMIFRDEPSERPQMVWASKEGLAPDATVRVEDGFLRSRGLGANLIPPLSLVLDDLGIYYDPTRVSRLDRWIAAREKTTPVQNLRAEALQRRLIADRLSKYNLGGTPPPLTEGYRILVPGQVEDDASILTGAGVVKTNLGLIKAVQHENPEACLIYKPHPDVEAGLRSGAVDPEILSEMGVTVAPESDPIALLDHVQEVWTMTSLLGFEALVRDVPVTCLGSPFYSGWGLTTDAGPVVAHRNTQVSLLGLIHAVLIDYPRYFDPKTGLACPVEVVIDRLRDGDIPHPGPFNRSLAKLQGWFAGHAYLWRK